MCVCVLLLLLLLLLFHFVKHRSEHQVKNDVTTLQQLPISAQFSLIYVLGRF